MPLALVAALAPGARASAQQTLLFATDADELTADLAGGLLEAATVRPGEICAVTPSLEGHVPRSILPVGAQWAYLGDADQDGAVVEHPNLGPGGAVDALFVKRAIGAPTGLLGPRDVFFSKDGESGFEDSFRNGDVVRFSAQGELEFFLREEHLITAMAESPWATANLDALCQSAAGDLFLSFEDKQFASGVLVEDGSIVIIPASAIDYDSAGNVQAMLAGSAAVFFDESVLAFIAAGSGMQTAAGVPPPTDLDLTALEIDVEHSTPEGGLHFLFAWSGSANNGAVLSTYSGGSIAPINGVPMGSAVATTGAHLGLLPGAEGVGGLGGLALLDDGVRDLTLQMFPSNSIGPNTSLWTRAEVVGAAPLMPVAVFVDFGLSGPTVTFPSQVHPAFDGELFGIGAPLLIGAELAGPNGRAAVEYLLPPDMLGSGANLAWQSLDFLTGRLATPSAMQVH